MTMRSLIFFVALLFNLFPRSVAAAETFAFKKPWLLTEAEPSAWSKDPSLVKPEELKRWQPYEAVTVPQGINKTIWLESTLPEVTDQRHVLYFANGLEDIAVYVDHHLIYSFGSFSGHWDEVSPQRWHAIPLNPEHSHRRLTIRTHYALGYVVRTLYPTIRLHEEVLAEHTSQSLPITFMAAWFGLLGFMVLIMAIMRRQLDLFLYFSVMAISISSWVLFNQDSVIKPYTGLPARSWSYFDLVGIYLASACLISFLSMVTQSKSKLISFVSRLNWGMAATVALISGLGGVHAWYLLPLLHAAVFPSLMALIPLIIWSAVRKNLEARILMVGSIAIAFAAIHDILRYSSNFKSPFTTMIPFGGLLMMMAMLSILLKRYLEEREAAFQTQAKLLADIQGLNGQLQIHVEEVEALVEEKTREIGSILSNIQQGIFMLKGPSLTIHPRYSEHLKLILGSNQLADKSFQDIFLSRCQLEMDQKNRILTALEFSLGEDPLNFEVNGASLPKEVLWQDTHGEKILELSWAPIADEHNDTDKILVTARDVTGLRQLQLAARRNQGELQLLQIILSSNSQRFMRFVESSLTLLSQVKEGLEQAPEIGLLSISRDLHTLKGNARSFNLDELASKVHEAETILHKQSISPSSQNRDILRNIVSTVTSELETCQEFIQNRLPMKAAADQVPIERQPLLQILASSYSSEAYRWQQLNELLIPRVLTSAESFFQDFHQDLERVAGELAKEIPQMNIEASGIYLTDLAVHVLTDSMGHLLRNALDHGIESTKDRLAAGKSSQGRISIICRREGSGLLITLQDDGPGLSLSRIKERSVETGLPSFAAPLTEAQIEEIIFAPGFSTKKVATMISGRGVGLDAVRATLEQREAHIRLRFTETDLGRDTRPFVFEISLPRAFFMEVPLVQDPPSTEKAS